MVCEHCKYRPSGDIPGYPEHWDYMGLNRHAPLYGKPAYCPDCGTELRSDGTQGPRYAVLRRALELAAHLILYPLAAPQYWIELAKAEAPEALTRRDNG